MLKTIAELYYKELLKIEKHQDWPLEQKFQALHGLLEQLFEQLTTGQKNPLPDTYTRIMHLADRYNLSKSLAWRLQLLHERARKSKQKGLPEHAYPNGLKTAALAIQSMSKMPVPAALEAHFPAVEEETASYLHKYQAQEQVPEIRVLLLSLEPADGCFYVQVPEQADPQRVRYDEAGYQANLSEQIELLQRALYNKGQKSIVYLRLLHVLVNEKDEWLPKRIILDPDYLVDVSGVAGAWDVANNQGQPLTYLLKKFIEPTNLMSLTLGNVANNMLDALMSNLNIEFKPLFQSLFQADPMSFISFSDDELKSLSADAQAQFVSLKRTLHENFVEAQIDRDNAVLEPSFFSARYGIQGRLDLWDFKPQSKHAKIVELKSGKPFMANAHNINPQHYLQVVLYDLLAHSVYEQVLKGINVSKYILYSNKDAFQNPLRPAPSSPATEHQALALRNRLVAMEYALMNLDEELKNEGNFFQRILNRGADKLDRFAKQDFEQVAKAFLTASPLEQTYFLSFSAFIAREEYQSKVGKQTLGTRSGMASMWLSKAEEKDENFELLNDLHIIAADFKREKPLIEFARGAGCNALANFRQGDSVILYPCVHQEDNVLNHQIFKGFISAIDHKSLSLRLSSNQVNAQNFNRFDSWRIEKQTGDSNGALYRSLFQFLSAPKPKRDLLLGLAGPSTEPALDFEPNFEDPQLSAEQKQLLRKIVMSRDYFLLVGPPGTGKTKFMLANLVRFFLNFTTERVLLLAYTNRAVDEICHALEPIARGRYLRISNRYNTDPAYHEALLDVKVGQTSNRKELRALFERSRIVVCTISKLLRSPVILNLFKADTVLIDEASQVLEPYLLGILTKVPRFVMIGDHKQLPAVVLQDEEESATNLPALEEIGLRNRRNSLFERLYNLAVAQGWSHAYDHLSHQGRMHQDIAAFPSGHYYEGNLHLLQGTAGDWQRQALAYRLPANASALETFIATRRIGFFDLKADGVSYKSSLAEAQKVVELILAFKRIYARSGKVFKPESLGVITPFRAQIAQIRHLMSENGLAQDLDYISIDTVERYQGGARDIILFSVCANNPGQLSRIASPSEDERVDRKLNVAITRARQHFYLLGDANLLRNNVHYAALLRHLAKEQGPS